jgi:hypothetical protein
VKRSDIKNGSNEIVEVLDSEDEVEIYGEKMDDEVEAIDDIEDLDMDLFD